MKFTYTRTFRIHHANGEFKILVTRTDLKGYYAGSVLYYDKERVGSNGNLTLLHFDLQTFINNNEETVLNECKSWIDENLGKDYKVEETYE